MHNIIPGLLSRLFRKPLYSSSVDRFLEKYEELNQRDSKKDLDEMREQIIAKVDSRFKSFIKKCDDYYFLSEMSYLVTMYIPHLTTYQKIKARTILAQLLAGSDDADKKELIGYVIRVMELDV